MVHVYVHAGEKANVVMPKGLSDTFSLEHEPGLVDKMRAAKDWIAVYIDHDISITDKATAGRRWRSMLKHQDLIMVVLL